MENTDSKIKKGLPPSKSPVCYQTMRDIVIPAGTILRHDVIQPGGETYSAGFGLYAKIVLDLEKSEMVVSDLFKKVIA